MMLAAPVSHLKPFAELYCAVLPFVCADYRTFLELHARSLLESYAEEGRVLVRPG